MNLEKTAIERIRTASQMALQHYGLPLVVTDSGGKDSAVCRELVRRSGVPFELMHNLTTADAPQTVYYVREQFQKAEQAGITCSINKPYYKGQRISMWSLIPMKMIPPTRTVRYCCEILKENGGAGRFILTGVRWAESRRRRNSRGIYENFVPNGKEKAVILNNDNDDTRRLFEVCRLRSKHVCNPIIDWSDQEVWEYIRSEKISVNPLYEMGFYRVGCIGCPMAGKQRYREFRIFPTYERAYRHAFEKMLELRKKQEGSVIPGFGEMQILFSVGGWKTLVSQDSMNCPFRKTPMRFIMIIYSGREEELSQNINYLLGYSMKPGCWKSVFRTGWSFLLRSRH